MVKCFQASGDPERNLHFPTECNEYIQTWLCRNTIHNSAGFYLRLHTIVKNIWLRRLGRQTNVRGLLLQGGAGHMDGHLMQKVD